MAAGEEALPRDGADVLRTLRTATAREHEQVETALDLMDADLVPGGRLRAFTPYGEDTGSMWHAFRRFTRAHVAGGGDAGAVVDSAGATFRALAAWCAPVARPVPA